MDSKDHFNKMMSANEIGHIIEILDKRLSYDPRCPSCLVWLDGKNKGKMAGTKATNGYWKVLINKRQLGSHRIVWFLNTGEWPEMYVNHLNLDRGDNRFENLSLETHTSNSQFRKRHSDNTSGVTGVTWITDSRFGLEYANCFYMDNGKAVNKRFSVNKLGRELAWKMAVEEREKVIKMKISRGENYNLEG